MFRYLKHKEIKYKLWDECIDRSANGIIYALSWYLDITTPGWEAIVKECNGKYAVAMPVPIFRKFAIKYVAKPIFSQQMGIFHQQEKLSKEEIKEIFQLLKKEISYVQRYDFNTENREVLSHEPIKYSLNKFYTQHLDLNGPYEEVSKKYDSNRKLQINKAKRTGIAIDKTEDINALIEIFDKNVAHKIYGVIGEEYEYKILRALYYEAKKRGLATFLAAHDEQGTLLSMGLFFRYNGKIIYIFNASTPQGRKVSAISLVIDKVLQDYSNQPFCFDFESPEAPNVAEFYRRFGSTAIPFASMSYNNLPLFYTFVKKARFYFYRKFMKSPAE